MGAGSKEKGRGRGEYKLKNVNQSKEGWEPGGSIEARTCWDAGISSRSPGGPICARTAHSRAAPSLHSSFSSSWRDCRLQLPAKKGRGKAGSKQEEGWSVCKGREVGERVCLFLAREGEVSVS